MNHWDGFHKEMELAAKAIKRIRLAFNNLNGTWEKVFTKQK